MFGDLGCKLKVLFSHMHGGGNLKLRQIHPIEVYVYTSLSTQQVAQVCADNSAH
jgi:hypothetical protein